MATKQKSILEKMQAVRKKIVDMGLLKKEGKNDFYKYQYLTANQIKALMNELLVKNGLEFNPTIEDVQLFEGTANRPLGQLVKINMQIYNIDNPKEYSEAIFYGVNVSNVSNGFYGAVTGAIKSYFESTFLIGSEDDPDATFPEQNVINFNGEMTPEQYAIINSFPDDIKEAIKARYGSLKLSRRDASAEISKMQNEGKISA